MVWTGRGGSGCQHVEQQVPGGSPFSWNCHSVRNGGAGSRRGPDERCVHAWGSSAVRTAAQRLLTPGGWEETWGMLLCAWEEWEGWQKEEESHGSGWHF